MTILSELKVPIFGAGGIPNKDETDFQLTVGGLVQDSITFSLEQIKELPFSTVNARLTSVAGWSVRAHWQGVLWQDFINTVELLSEASHAIFSSHGSVYKTTVSLKDLDHPRVLLVYAVNGEPLEWEYGGPLRMVIPSLYGYKSAKWLKKIEFTDTMGGGFWEDKGYSRSGVIEPGTTLDINSGIRRNIKGGEILDF